jgi:hypothetical protein
VLPHHWKSVFQYIHDDIMLSERMFGKEVTALIDELIKELKTADPALVRFIYRLVISLKQSRTVPGHREYQSGHTPDTCGHASDHTDAGRV